MVAHLRDPDDPPTSPALVRARRLVAAVLLNPRQSRAGRLRGRAGWRAWALAAAAALAAGLVWWGLRG